MCIRVYLYCLSKLVKSDLLSKQVNLCCFSLSRNDDIYQDLLSISAVMSQACCFIIVMKCACSVDFNACWAKPCLHGATCTQRGHDYTCKCTRGYVGTRCER